jgi:hypothetical protein
VGRRLFDRYGHEVVSLAILADADPNWRPTGFSYGRWGFRSGTEFPSVKLLDYGRNWQALEASSNPFATVVMAHLKTLETRHAPADRQAWKVRLVKGLYDRRLSPEDVVELVRFIDWLMDLPPALEQLFWQEVYRDEEEQTVPHMMSNERMALAAGLVAGIEAILAVRFGAEGLKLLPEIRELQDVDTLRAVLQASKTVATPEEVRQIWVPAPRSRKRRRT